MKKFVFIVVLFFVFCPVIFGNINVKPAIMRAKVDAVNESYDIKFQVSNLYDDDIVVKVSVVDWNPISVNKDFPAEKWLTFEKKSYGFKPNEIMEIKGKLHINKNMSGSVSGRVYFETKRKTGGIKLLISVPIYVTIRGTEDISFNIIKSYFTVVNDNIFYNFEVSNNGNVHIRPSGRMKLYNSKKEIVKNIYVSESAPVYAEKTKLFSEKVFNSKELKKGKYKAEFILKALGKEVLNEIKFKVKKNGIEVIK